MNTRSGKLRTLALGIMIAAQFGLGADLAKAAPPARASHAAAAAPVPALPSVTGPVEVTARQTFTVQVVYPTPESAVGAQMVNLYVLDEMARGGTPPIVLSGTLSAPVINGTAVFPGVALNGDSLERPIRLVALILTATGSVSALSAPIVVHAPPEPRVTLQDVTFGGVGVEILIDRGQLVVYNVPENMPAKAAGVEAKDKILKIDGISTTGLSLDDISKLLKGPVGKPVVVTVQHSNQEIRDITIERSTMTAKPLDFEAISNQTDSVPFQVTVMVRDDEGHPLPGAEVKVAVDSDHSSAHFLFISSKTNLGDGSGFGYSELSTVTGQDGRATMWVRLSNGMTPFGCSLSATATYKGHTSSAAKSNDFQVYSSSNKR